MIQCKQCGATLPENSRYCLQCGTENRATEGTNGPQKELDFLKPSILGGLALGVLSAAPLISILNVVCCLWAQAGGGLTVWLLDKQRPGTLKYGDGALGGLVSGLIGAFVATLINIPIQMIAMTPERIAAIQSQFEELQISPAVRDAILQFMSPGFNLSRALIMLLLNMILLGLFAMIGGILAVAIVNRKRID